MTSAYKDSGTRQCVNTDKPLTKLHVRGAAWLLTRVSNPDTQENLQTSLKFRARLCRTWKSFLIPNITQSLFALKIELRSPSLWKLPFSLSLFFQIGQTESRKSSKSTSLSGAT